MIYNGVVPFLTDLYPCVLRPTAAELLKHPFFRKAKDKKFIQQMFTQSGPKPTAPSGKARSSLVIILTLLFALTDHRALKYH